ncbi:hypothetical protein [Flavobacterium gelatinilyticum]|uniref:hypothetical protein n=1 Tax=Flavobacterium gelatinilyticum TaxID=3003260 RepID=UPI0024817CF8|nr:hypothetical protein [Flavobacterium gelatinilyticum]
MSKVKLTLSEYHLSTLVYSLDHAPQVPVKDRIAKIAKSVLDKITVSFKKKQLDVKHTSIYEYKKKKKSKPKQYVFSLELVEAHFLEQFLLSMTSFPFSDYDRNVVNMLIANLNKELA